MSDGKWDQAKGKAREGLGKLTNDKKQESKGKAEQGSGKVKEKVSDTRDSVEGATEGIRESFSEDKDKNRR
ncbi:CsbD family protein [Alkalibacterium sp. MB6]|uniref:CsbD family protein n=1 Tax=Alkalibacterium sp. MB6 TaxID=2081965 RepID=UPI00137AD03A|nr:CsbD family protein [Alkalibacterium sp. MB6]